MLYFPYTGYSPQLNDLKLCCFICSTAPESNHEMMGTETHRVIPTARAELYCQGAAAPARLMQGFKPHSGI